MEEKTDLKDVAEILDVVSTKVPSMIQGIFKAMYSQENGIEAGKAVGGFYRNLIESGIPSDIALRLTERYMFSIRDVVDIAQADKQKGSSGGGEE